MYKKYGKFNQVTFHYKGVLFITGSIGHIENFFNLYGHFHKKYGSFVKMEGILSRPPMVIMFEPEHYDQVSY